MKLKADPAQGSKVLATMIEGALDLMGADVVEFERMDAGTSATLRIDLAGEDCCYRTYIVTVRPSRAENRLG